MTAHAFLLTLLLLVLGVRGAEAQSQVLSAKQLNRKAHETLSSAQQYHRSDSAAMFRLERLALGYAIRCDSAELDKGNKMKFRESNRHRFQRVRSHLIVAADYYMRHSCPDAARGSMEFYLGSARSSLFATASTDTATAAYLLSSVALLEGRYADADRWADRALTDTRTAQRAAEVKAMVMEATMQTAADSTTYAAVLTRLYQSNPESPRYFSWLMDFYSNPNQQQNLEDFIDRQLERHPDELMPWILKAEVAMKSQRWDEAADTYLEVLKAGVRTAPILYNRALCLTNLAAEDVADTTNVETRQVASRRRLEEARDCLKQLAEVDPTCRQIDWGPLKKAVDKALKPQD